MRLPRRDRAVVTFGAVATTLTDRLRAAPPGIHGAGDEYWGLAWPALEWLEGELRADMATRRDRLGGEHDRVRRRRRRPRRSDARPGRGGARPRRVPRARRLERPRFVRGRLFARRTARAVRADARSRVARRRARVPLPDPRLVERRAATQGRRPRASRRRVHAAGRGRARLRTKLAGLGRRARRSATGRPSSARSRKSCRHSTGRASGSAGG